MFRMCESGVLLPLCLAPFLRRSTDMRSMAAMHSGRDSIFVYSFNEDGTLNHLAEVPTHGQQGHEGVRHSIPSRDGGRLYVVTEHSESAVSLARGLLADCRETDSTLR